MCGELGWLVGWVAWLSAGVGWLVCWAAGESERLLCSLHEGLRLHVCSGIALWGLSCRGAGHMPARTCPSMAQHSTARASPVSPPSAPPALHREWREVAEAWREGAGALNSQLREKYVQHLLAFELELRAGCEGTEQPTLAGRRGPVFGRYVHWHVWRSNMCTGTCGGGAAAWRSQLAPCMRRLMETKRSMRCASS